jgi:uncharacterized protein
MPGTNAGEWLSWLERHVYTVDVVGSSPSSPTFPFTSSRCGCALSLSYEFAPLVGWLVAGSIKTIVSSIKTRRWHTDFLGYGGIPSTHTTIITTTATLIALREGTKTPEFALALTVAVLVMMDAMSLRQWVGAQAAALNRLQADDPDRILHRERVGHKPWEVLAGIVLGIASGCAMEWLG